MLPKVIGNYGGPFVDARLIKDPRSQMAAAFGNRCFEDGAQMTRTSVAVWVSFPTTTDAGPVTIDAADVTCFTQWGSSTSFKPVVQKTSTGEYTLTFAETYDDALVSVAGMESVAETQNVVFTFATRPNTRDNNWSDARVTTIASNVVNVVVYDDTLTQSDLGGGILVEFCLR